jgi:hypothetical protein
VRKHDIRDFLTNLDKCREAVWRTARAISKTAEDIRKRISNRFVVFDNQMEGFDVWHIALQPSNREVDELVTCRRVNVS